MDVTVLIGIGSAILTSIIGPIAVHLVKLKTQKKETKDAIKESLENDILIEKKIEEIKEDYKADRVWVAQFHNGGYFYPTGKSIQKFSIVYEIVEKGVTSIQSNFQNIPISLFSKSINQLLEYDLISVQDYSDDSIQSYGLKYVAEETGCKSGYSFAIKSIEGRFIGIMGVDYVQNVNILPDNDIHSLAVEASAIGGVLMNHVNSK